MHIEGLTKIYRSGDAELVIFADLNFEVERGERLALVGESGTANPTPASAGQSGQANKQSMYLPNKKYPHTSRTPNLPIPEP